MRFSRRHILGLSRGALSLRLPARAIGRAQAYPSRPVRVIVPVAPGGANDTTARLFAQKLSESLGPTASTSRIWPAAGGNIGMGNAARAAPDGYTLLAAGGSFVINPSLYAKIPYDPLQGFRAGELDVLDRRTCSRCIRRFRQPTVTELVALAKANPGTLSYASAGRGTPAHLAGELFKLAFELDITHVPFTGGGPAMTATIGGHTSIASSRRYRRARRMCKAGNVRALAMMSAKRSSLLPDVPTMAEATGPISRRTS